MSRVITFGEIMLRLSTPGYLRFSQARQFDATFGGGEANVAVSLANFGIDAAFVTRLPDNDIARACLRDLRSYGVDTSLCITGGDRLGIYFLETGAVARPSKVVYDRAGSSIAAIEPGMIDWDKVFEGADWFHWTGITPAISRGAAEACLEAVRAARRLGLTVSCDLNYRKNLWKYGQSASEVMPALVEGCDIILGNEEDAEKVEQLIAFVKAKVAAGELETDDDVRKAIAEGEEKFGIKLGDDEIAKIVGIMQKIRALGLDPGMLVSQAEDLYNKFGIDFVNHMTAEEVGKEVAGNAVKNFFSNIGESIKSFFSGIFGG